jgi:hypothetical protein
MPHEADLVIGQRYMFYVQMKPDSPVEIRRGTFLEIREIETCSITHPIMRYLYVKNNYHTTPYSRQTITITPFNWIQRIETLDELLDDITTLPSDVVHIIDSFF